MKPMEDPAIQIDIDGEETITRMYGGLRLLEALRETVRLPPAGKILLAEDHNLLLPSGETAPKLEMEMPDVWLVGRRGDIVALEHAWHRHLVEVRFKDHLKPGDRLADKDLSSSFRNLLTDEENDFHVLEQLGSRFGLRDAPIYFCDSREEPAAFLSTIDQTLDAAAPDPGRQSLPPPGAEREARSGG